MLSNRRRVPRERFVDQLVEEVGVIDGGSDGDGDTEERSASRGGDAVGELLQSAKDPEDDFVAPDIGHGEHGDAAVLLGIAERR